MQYVSTRGGVPAASYSEIVLQGLARDGGLFVPKVYPQVSKETLKNWRGLSYAQLATAVTSLFAKDMQRSDIARLCETDRKSTRLNSSHANESRMPSSA